ncbi:MAG: hypothetical protein WCT04_07600 [Planctomycetota bacterium]
MKSYTVIGYFEDNGQVWCEHVKAETPFEAMQKSVKLLKGRDNEDVPDDNMAVVGVFAGHRKEIGGSWAVSYASDLLCEKCACGASLGDGEGYDGKCGNCADKAESKKERAA